MNENTKQSERAFEGLLKQYFENDATCGFQDVIAMLQRSGVKWLNKRLVLSAVADAAHHQNVRSFERAIGERFPGVDQINIEQLIEAMRMAEVNWMDKDTLRRAVMELNPPKPPKPSLSPKIEPAPVAPPRESSRRERTPRVNPAEQGSEHGREGAQKPEPKPPEEAPKAEVVPRHEKMVYKLDSTPSGALVIHCGDPRFQTAFRRFVTEELGIQSYTPIVLGGGIHAFGTQAFLPKNFKILWEQIKFFVKERHLKQLILINHENCQWYGKMRHMRPTIDLPTQGKLDLATAAERLVEDFGGITVRKFFAEIHGDEIRFREIA